MNVIETMRDAISAMVTTAGNAEDERAGVARQEHQRQEGDDVDDRAVEDRAPHAERSEPRGAPGRFAVIEFAIDRVGRDHRIVHQHAERDDERGDGDLVQLDAGEMHSAENHRDRERDGGGDDERGTPIHEQERNENHDHNRFEKRADEMMQAILDRGRLIRERLDLHVFRQPRLRVSARLPAPHR